MTWSTHVIGGLQAGIIASCVIDASPENSAVIIGASVLGSILPDIDHPDSKITRSDSLLSLVSHGVSRFTKHRGFTHTIIGALVFALLFYGLAIFRTGAEGVLSFFVAIILFSFLHLAGGDLAYIAGWLAAAAYIFGPQIIRFLTNSNINLSFNRYSALLYAVGIFIGCLAHMFYDTFNKGGIMWFWPFTSKKYRFMTIKTNTRGEVGFGLIQFFLLFFMMMTFVSKSGIFDMANSAVHTVF